MNADTPLDGSLVLPASIIQALRRLIGRARCLIMLRGLCAAWAAGVGAFLVIMSIDAGFTLLARWPRWVMTGTAYSIWAGSLFWFLIRPLARSFTLAGIARLIEAHHPELQERLSSVVELLGSRDVPSIRGSDVLIGALTEEAVRDAVRLKPQHEISFRAAIPFAVTAGLVLALLAAVWLARPRQTRFLLARAVAPFLNLPNVYAADLHVEPGDTLIASGSRLRISIQAASPAVTSARLRQRDRLGRETVTDMVAVPASTNGTGRTFAVTLPAVLTGFQYRIHAGDALTRYFTVRVAIPPIIEHLDVRCRPPEYSRLVATQVRDGSGTLRALAGSEITVSATVNKAVPSAVMLIDRTSSTNTIKGVSRGAAQGVVYDFSLTLPRQLNGSWTLNLVDEIGLRNAPFEYAIQSIPDNPPVAVVVNPRQRELRLNRDARLPVAYSAEDDLGLTGLALVFTIAGMSNETIRPLPLPAQAEQGVKAMQGETQIALDDPLFAGAARIAFRLRATDNLPGPLGGPQSGDSATVTILLDERAASWKEQVLTSQEERAQQGLKQVQQKLASAREQARALDAPLAQQAAPSADTARKIDALQDALASADHSLRDIAVDVDKGFFAALATNLIALADDHVSKAENMAGQLRLVDRPAERTDINSNLTAEIETSLRAVEHAILDHDIARSAVRRAVELDRLTDKQTVLAQTRQTQEQAAPPPASNSVAVAQAAAASNDWRKAQDQVADRLAALAREAPGTPEQVAVATSNLAVSAASQASELAARQGELAALTRQQTDRLQNQEREGRELAARQDQLAALARREPLSALQGAPMQQAAKELAAGNTEPAVQAQTGVADALRKDADRRMETPNPVQGADDPGRMAASALQKADDGLQLARQSAERAEQGAERAQMRADTDAALVKRAETTKQQDLVKDMTGRAAESRQAAKDASQWSQVAGQAADQAKRAAAETRNAAKQAGREDQPEPARRAAAAQAVHAAEQVEQLAEAARTAAHQANVNGVERGSPQERAVQAEERALDAAREASQSALKAGVTAERARQEAGQAEKQTDQALVNGASPRQVQESSGKAAEARARADAAGEAAAKSRQEARQAREEAQVAQQATDKTFGEQPLAALKGHAEAAETASEAAQQAAWRAAEQARLADEATQTPRSARERAMRAAQQAARQAAQAEQAAAAVQKEAQSMTRPSAEARRLAERVWKTGQNDLAQSTGQKSRNAREQAERVQALADTAQTMAAASRQAAEKASDAERQAGQTGANGQVRNVEQAAQEAGAKAEQVRAIAEKAKEVAGPKPTAAAVAGEAQQSARQAQDAQQIAQQAAQSAQQAAQKAGEAAQQTAQQAAAIRQAAGQSAQVAEQAEKEAQQSKGKPEQAETARRAQAARQAAQLAKESETGAQRVAQQTQQAAQQTQQSAQESQQAAQASQQSAQAAQQAAQQAQQAAATAAPQAAQKGRLDAGQAAQASIEKAQVAVDAAARANASAKWAQEQLAAVRLSDLATQQEVLRRQSAALLAGKEGKEDGLGDPFSGRLAKQQQALSAEVAALAQAATVIREQTEEVLARSPAGPPAGQAAREMAQAAQAADQAAQQMEQVARRSEDPAKRSAQNLQQAAETIRQAQQGAAQTLQQAARNLQNAAQAMVIPATPPTTPAGAAPVSPATREALAKAYEDARQTAMSGKAIDAAQTAAQLAQAADQAAAEAKALGANARPATLETAASGGGGLNEDAQASEDIPTFARRLGMKLQDWLRLHGELKEDVLQASGSEGPEEYRPLIKRYFREVSGHGGEE